MKHLDLTGQRFGHLTVLRFVRNAGNGHGALWLALCDCGQERQVTGCRLRSDARQGRKTTCCECARKRRGENLKRWRLTREKELLSSNPHAPRETITPRNYAKYFLTFTASQWQRYKAIVLRHRGAARDEYYGMDQVRCEAVEAVILEPDGVVEREVETRERYDYRYAYSE